MGTAAGERGALGSSPSFVPEAPGGRYSEGGSDAASDSEMAGDVLYTKLTCVRLHQTAD